MRGRYLFILIGFILLSCSEEDLPGGLLDRQVERILSGQEGTKTWDRIVRTTNCIDSLKVTFGLVEDSNGDSLDITISQYQEDCTIQDLLIGRANASSVEGGDLFTDSLVFSDGNYWIITEITSQQLRIEIDEQLEAFSFNQ